MATRGALHHETCYRYPKPVWLSLHVVKSAPDRGTTISRCLLKVTPNQHFVNGDQTPFTNRWARLVLPNQAEEFSVAVDLVARQFPFTLDLRLA